MSKEMAKADQPSTDSAPSKAAPATDAGRQLNDIRDLLFGEQLRSVHQRSHDLEHRLQNQLQDMNANFSSALNQLRQDTDQQFSAINQRLDALDNKHSEQAKALSGDINNLATELAEKYQILNDKLAATSEDLKNNKTDRKMLAGLLSGMANNLSIDEQS